MTLSSKHFDIAVIGTGPVGLTAALALAQTGLEVGLIGPPECELGRREDLRTAALFAGSIEILRNLDVWPKCEAECAALEGIRILDGHRTLLRAPEVVFRASDADLDAFGFNVPNQVLTRSLWQCVREQSAGITCVGTNAVTNIENVDGKSVIHFQEGGTAVTTLLVGADGRNSMSRAYAGINHRTWTYPQTAISCMFTHTRAHGGLSTEFHYPHGPLTVVPMPGKASSLVWVTSPQEAERLQQLDDDRFAQALEKKLNGLLGEIRVSSKRGVFPLSALTAEVFGSNGVALVGEAAHVIPPIGAQGLNLGLRDCASLADCVAGAVSEGRSGADHKTLRAYHRAREFDIRSRTSAVDIFNRSLITSFLPAHLARGAGLHALKSIVPLRRTVIREGLMPSGVMPALMQIDGLAKLKTALVSGHGKNALRRKNGQQARLVPHS